MSRVIDGMSVTESDARSALGCNHDSFVCDRCGETIPGAALYGDGCDLCGPCAERADEQAEVESDADRWLAEGAEAHDAAVARIELQAAADRIVSAALADSFARHAEIESEAAE